MPEKEAIRSVRVLIIKACVEGCLHYTYLSSLVLGVDPKACSDPIHRPPCADREEAVGFLPEFGDSLLTSKLHRLASQIGSQTMPIEECDCFGDRLLVAPCIVADLSL